MREANDKMREENDKMREAKAKAMREVNDEAKRQAVDRFRQQFHPSDAQNFKFLQGPAPGEDCAVGMPSAPNRGQGRAAMGATSRAPNRGQSRATMGVTSKCPPGGGLTYTDKQGKEQYHASKVLRFSNVKDVPIGIKPKPQDTKKYDALQPYVDEIAWHKSIWDYTMGPRASPIPRKYPPKD